MTLNEFFKDLPDSRRSQGQRYALSDVLWMIFLGISCGYVGYRSLNKFVKANSDYDEINIRLAHARGRMERMKVLKLCKAQATTMTVSLNSVL